MATYVPSNTWSTGLSNAGSSSLGNPADLGPYRGMQSQRGQKYDDRADYGYEWGREKAGEIDELGKTVSGRALDTGAMFNDWAKADRGFWEGTYKPAMQEQMDFARNYTTDARKAANRGGAMSDVAMTFDSAADMSKRALQGYGINPNSGNFVGLDAGLAASRAKALAGAGTKSDRDTEMLGQEYLNRAIQTGSRLPDQAVNAAGVGIAANNQAINTGIASAGAQRALQEPTGWVGAGDEALKEWKNSLLQQTQLGMQQNRDTLEAEIARQRLAQGGSSGTGAMVGGGMGMLGSVLKMAGPMMGGMGGMGGGGGAMMGSGFDGGMGGADMSMSGMTFEKGGMVPHLAQGGEVGWDEWTNKAGGFSGMDPTGYAGFATDAIDIAGDIGGGADYDVERGDKLGIFGDSELDQGEQIGGSTGSLVGRIIGSFWGMPGVGAMAGRDIGEGAGAMVQGRWGEGFENLGRNAVSRGTSMMMAEGGAVPEEQFDWDWAEEGQEVTPEVSAGASPNANPNANMVPPEASPSGGTAVDDVTARVSAGEFVVPKDVTAWYGEKYMQGLIDKARKEMQTKTAEPTMGPAPPQAMAISPTFQSEGAGA